ncbi:MAG: hypothetical protein LBH92_06920 [Bacteroidales bacterium]|jgi:hypothetical protein|nr:hypothetical protein [Bacteroidales bacterium]
MTKFKKPLFSTTLSVLKESITAVSCIILVGLLLTTGCSENSPTTNLKENGTALQGAKWKLVGIVDIQTDTLKELDPKDCEECYTITFITDTKAEGMAFREKIELDLSLLGEYSITAINRTEEDEKFMNVLYNQNTKFYSVTLDELKFINKADNYYLQFKRI